MKSKCCKRLKCQRRLKCEWRHFQELEDLARVGCGSGNTMNEAGGGGGGGENRIEQRG
jgi:hypothetical protein